MNDRKKLLIKGLWFFIFNTLFFLLVSSRYFKYINQLDSFITISYVTITTISHFMTLSIIGFIIYAPFILLFPYPKFAWILSTLISSTGLVLLTIDTYVFDFYRMHINSFILELLFGGAAKQIFNFHINQYLLSICTIVLYTAIMLSISYTFFRSNFTLNLKKQLLIKTLGCLVLMIFFSHFTHAWATAANYSPITKSSTFYPLYFPTSSTSLMLKLNLVTEEEIRNNLHLSAHKKFKDLNYPKNEIITNDSARTNIILILIDSWHHKSFDSLITPNIYNFSKNCEVYHHHYSGDNGTRTGVFSLFYSIPGLYWYNILTTNTSPILMNQLIKKNYEIRTFPSAKLTSPPFDRTIFSKVQDISLETEGEQTYHRDEQITNNWLSSSLNDSIEGNNQPKFSFLFYDALHGTYHPGDFKGPFQPEWSHPKFELLNNELDPTLYLNMYNNTAYFVDSLIGNVLNDIKIKGLLNNSWVIITGDHGQEFNDNKKNYWGHGSNYSPAQLQVPLIVYKPNKSKKEYTHWTSHYDIVPTLMEEIFQCKNPIFDYSIGFNLSDTTNRSNLIVGSPDKFGIIQSSNRINTVFYNGTFEITDFKLNPIPDAKLEVNIIDSVLIHSNSFYKK